MSAHETEVAIIDLPEKNFVMGTYTKIAISKDNSKYFEGIIESYLSDANDGLFSRTPPPLL